MEITSYLIIGVMVSTLVQYLKVKFGTESLITKLIVVGLSIAVGLVYFLVKDTQFYQSTLLVLVFAGAFYTYILQTFEK
jgi:hypothetical protein